MHLKFRTPTVNQAVSFLFCLYLICPLQMFCNEAAEEKLAHKLLIILRDTGKSARFEYTTRCNAKYPYVIRYPGFTFSDYDSHGDAISRIRSLLGDNKDIVVTEDPDGTIVIKASGVKADPLEIAVDGIRFDPIERWNPDYALITVWDKKQFKGPLAALRMEQEEFIFAYLLTPPGSKDLPYLPTVVPGPTMKAVIDNILKQFRGLAIYRECKREDGSRVFGTDGYSVENYDFKGTSSMDK